MSRILSHKENEREQILTLYRRGRITSDDLERQLDAIASEAAELRARLATLETTLQGQEAIAVRLQGAQDLLASLRGRLKQDFTDVEKRELIELLVLGIRVDAPDKITATYVFEHREVNFTSTRAQDWRRPRSAPYALRSNRHMATAPWQHGLALVGRPC